MAIDITDRDREIMKVIWGKKHGEGISKRELNEIIAEYRMEVEGESAFRVKEWFDAQGKDFTFDLDDLIATVFTPILVDGVDRESQGFRDALAKDE